MNGAPQDARVLPEVVELRAIYSLGPDGRLVEGPDRDPDHPVWDLERLARVVLDGHVRATSTALESRDFLEALTFLIGESYVLAPRYDPSRGRVHFAAWIQGQLRFRLQDHLRAPYGKRAEHRIGQGRFAELDRGDPAEGRDALEFALAREHGARDDDRDDARAWLLATRDRGASRPLVGMGRRAARATAA